MIFEITPVPKISTNKIYAGLHWSKRKAIAADYHLSVLSEVRKRKLSQYGMPVAIFFTFSFKGKLLDCSNCTFMAKMIEDGLVCAGIIKDDSPKYVEEIRIVSKKGEKDIVTIEIKGHAQ